MGVRRGIHLVRIVLVVGVVYPVTRVVVRDV